MLIGEAPGKVESQTLKPFSGPSGKKLSIYMSLADLPPLDSCYRTNLVKSYIEGNPEPTSALIRQWEPTLLQEIESVRPKVIFLVGRHAAEWALGPHISDLETIHGMPHRTTAHLPSCVRDSILIPLFHPAGALWNYERGSLIRYGYECAGEVLKDIDSGREVKFREDPFAECEEYTDVTGAELESFLSDPYLPQKIVERYPDYYVKCPAYSPHKLIIGFDTEGEPGAEWSAQYSFFPGTGFLLRCKQSDFKRGIYAFSKWARQHNVTIAMHQASTPRCSCYDVVMSRRMHLELQGLLWFDTMSWAYVRRLESKSNKTLAERWQGAEMEDYQSLLAGLSKERQIEYLKRALTLSLPKPEKVHWKENDGTLHSKQPQHIHRVIERILADIDSGKINTDGPVDPAKRWKKVESISQKKAVESALGRMPQATLSDIPLERALFYSARDSDVTLRNALRFMEINSYNPRLSRLMANEMRLLPTVERMQYNGMPVSISAIRQLHSEMESELDDIRNRISGLYWDGEPFNPNSTQQTAFLCRRLGIRPSTKTPTGATSTSKKSIEEYRFSYPAIGLVFDWRERAKLRDQYCNDVLVRVPDGYTEDILTIHANFEPCKVPTGRLATSHPNVLGVPVRSELGVKVRECYIAPLGKLWVGFDLSGVEVRCLTHLSMDPLWVAAFNNGINPHLDTASRLFKVPLDKVSKEQKAVAKTVNFLIIYGGGASNLYDQLRSNHIPGYDLSACKALIRNWWAMYSGVDAFRKTVIAEARHTEISIDHWGRARYLPGINCDDERVRGEEERAAVSQKVQGLARGMLRNSLAWMWPILESLISEGELDTQCFRLDIHDELDFLVNEGEEEVLIPLVMEALRNHCGVKLCVPVEAEYHIGHNWGEIK